VMMGCVCLSVKELLKVEAGIDPFFD